MDLLKTRKAVHFFIVLFFLGACDNVLNTDDYKFEDLEVTPTMAVPLAYGDMSIRELLKSADSSYVKIYSDGLVYLEYDQTLRTQALRDLIVIPDKNDVTSTLAVPAGTLSPVVSDYTSTEEEKIEYLDITPEKLTEALFKQGRIVYDITITPPNPDFRYAVTVTIPEFKQVATNQIFSQDLTGSDVIDLTNYLYSSPTPNQVTIDFKLIIKQNPNATTIDAGTVVTTKLSFQNLDFAYAKGFFGDQSIDIPAERVDVNAFGNALLDGADISFAEPAISFNVINDVGAPTKVTFTTLEARKPGNSLPMQITPSSPIDINYPDVLGNTAATLVTVDNAKALVDFAPTHFYYKAEAHINDGLTSGNNFIADTSALKLNMHAEIPLYGHASNIILTDTIEIDLSGTDPSNVESAALKVKALNEMPLEARIQFYFTDGSYNVLDSLLAPEKTLIIKSSLVDNSGELQSPGEVDDLIPISIEKIQNLFQSSFIIIKARVNTTPGPGNVFPDVKFKSNYKMKVNLGLQAKIKITADL